MDTQQLTRQTDSSVVLPGPARPVSFAGLMTLYESNYVRLKWLLPELPADNTCVVSTVGADMALYLRVIEVSRYTTTLVLTYLFQGGPAPVCEDSADANNDGGIDLADSVYLLNYLFADGPAPVAPFPDCALSTLPADEALGCETPPESCVDLRFLPFPTIKL